MEFGTKTLSENKLHPLIIAYRHPIVNVVYYYQVEIYLTTLSPSLLNTFFTKILSCMLTAFVFSSEMGANFYFIRI